MSTSTRSLLSSRRGRPFSVRTSLQGESLTMRMPALTSELLARIDCRTPLGRVLGELQEQRTGNGGSAPASAAAAACARPPFRSIWGYTQATTSRPRGSATRHSRSLHTSQALALLPTPAPWRRWSAAGVPFYLGIRTGHY